MAELRWALVLAALCQFCSARPRIPLAQRCTSEVLRLHAFFEDWWNARLPQTRHNFHAGFTSANHPEFTFVSPLGTGLGLNATAEYIYGAYGTRYTDDWATADQVQGHDMRFLLSNITVTWVDEPSETCTVTFQEHQQVGGAEGPVQTKANACVLKRMSGAPNGLGWLLEHETWWPGWAHRGGCEALRARGLRPEEIPACYNCTGCLAKACAECLHL